MRLISRRGVTLIYGVRMTHAGRRTTSEPDFPPWAAIVGGDRLWQLDDVIAYRDGSYTPNRRRTPGWLDGKVLGAGEAAERLGISVGSMQHYMGRREEPLPPPNGKAGNVNWWLTRDVDKFIRERERRRECERAAHERRQAPLRRERDEVLAIAGPLRLVNHTGISLILEVHMASAYRRH